MLDTFIKVIYTIRLLLKFIHMIKLSDKQLIAISFSLPHSFSLSHSFYHGIICHFKIIYFLFLVECSSCHRVDRPEDCNMSTVCDPDEVRICQNTCNPE